MPRCQRPILSAEMSNVPGDKAVGSALVFRPPAVAAWSALTVPPHDRDCARGLEAQSSSSFNFHRCQHTCVPHIVNAYMVAYSCRYPGSRACSASLISRHVLKARRVITAKNTENHRVYGNADDAHARRRQGKDDGRARPSRAMTQTNVEKGNSRCAAQEAARRKPNSRSRRRSQTILR